MPMKRNRSKHLPRLKAGALNEPAMTRPIYSVGCGVSRI